MTSQENRPPTVVRIIARLNTGGPTRHVALAADGLTKMGYDHHLIYGAIEEDEGDMSGLVPENSGTQYYVAPMKRSVSPLDDLRAIWEISKILRCVRPDVVHTHTAKAGLLGRTAAWLTRTPTIIHTYHGHVFHGYFGKTQTRFYLTVERMLAKVTTTIVTLSPSLASELQNEYKVGRPGQYEIVSLGLDLEAFARSTKRGNLRSELGMSPGTPILGSIGRLVPIKDFALLVRSFGELATEFPDMNLVIAGDGDEREPLRQLAADLGLTERVHLLGWRQDIDNLMTSFDVFALTSKNEGTPVAIIEAMSCGTPVAATDVGGVSDLLNQGVGGELIAERTPEACASSIKRAIKMPRSSPEDRRIVAERFGKTQLVANLDKIMSNAQDRSDQPAGPRSL